MRKKEVKKTTLNFLEKLLENQLIIMDNQEELLVGLTRLESSVEEINDDIEKITRRLKRLST